MGPVNFGLKILATLSVGLLIFLVVYVVVLSPEVPRDFPSQPLIPEGNSPLRALIVRADAEARAHPASAEAIGRLAMIYHANFYFDQARSAYRLAARLGPTDPRWYYYRARLEGTMGEHSAMLALLQRTLQLEPDHGHAKYELAEALLKQGDVKAAKAAYAEMIQAGASLSAIVGRTHIASLESDWPTAIEFLEPAAAKHPRLRQIHQMLAEAYEETGRTREALAERKFLRRDDLFDAIPVEDPLREELDSLCTLPTPLMNRARSAEKAGDFGQMLRLSRKAVAADPDDAEALHFLSRALVLADGSNPESIREALALRDKALGLQADNLNPLVALSGALIARDRLEEAQNTLRILLTEDPDSAEGHNNLGVIFARQRKFERAIAEYRKALNTNPESTQTWNNLGRILADLGKLHEAVLNYRRALEIDRNYADCHFNLAVALAAFGELQRALLHFSEALEIRPKWGAAHSRLGIVLAAVDRTEDALFHFKQAVRIDPADVEAQENLGVFWAQRGHFDQAINHFQEALRIQPANPRVRQMLELALRRSPKSVE